MQKISGKIFVIFILMLSVMLASAFSSYIATNTQEQHILLTEVLGAKQLKVERVTKAAQYFTELRILDSGALSEKSYEIDQINIYLNDVDQIIANLLNLQYPQEDGSVYELEFNESFTKSFVDALRANQQTWYEVRENIKMVTENDMLEMEDKEAFLESVRDVNEIMIEQSDDVMRICREAADYQKQVSDLVQWGTVAFAIIIFIFLIFFVTRNIYKPVVYIKKMLGILARGDLTRRFEGREKDEFGEVYDGLNHFLNSLDQIFEIENNIIKESELEELLCLMANKMSDFMTFSTIGMVYSKYDGSATHLRLYNEELIHDRFVDKIDVYDNVVEQNGSLVVPIKIGANYLGYYYFDDYKTVLEGSNFIHLVRDKLTIAFYKNILVKDLLSIITEALADTTEARDPETGDHLVRMSNYAQIIAKELKKTDKYKDIIDTEFIENILITAPMHDIGKIGIADSILLKPGKLTDEEYAIMKTHAAYGGDILTSLDKKFRYYGITYFKMAADIAYGHHEKFSGGGYPNGIVGYEINLPSRIIALADVFDALTSKRPYKEAFSLEKSYGIIEESIGTHFDPEIAEAFFRGKEEIEAIYNDFKEI